MTTKQLLHKLQLVAMMPTIIENGLMLVIGIFSSDLKKARNYKAIKGIIIYNNLEIIFNGGN
ncbi:MAG: hypothetical protein PVF37_10200 [Desulfobacterales bacterium]|jgi:hypothetical protein